MPLQLFEFSKVSSKEKFISEFIKHPTEAMYFKFYQLEHDFILIKSEESVLLKAMICRSPFEGISYFGLFEYDNTSEVKYDVLDIFKNYVLSWNKLRDLKNTIGPINFSTWLPYRLPIFRDGGPLFSFEPHFPLDYHVDLKRIGFSTHKIYSSKGFSPISRFIENSESDFEKSKSLGFTFEFFPKKLDDGLISDLYRLSLKGFENNYLATPIDLSTFKQLYKIGSGIKDFSYSVSVKSANNGMIGFFICFLEQNYAICKTIAVDPIYRGKGLSNAMFHKALSKFRSSGINQMVSAMVIEGAQSESYGKKMHLEWTHLYEILELLT
jgi:hypothetical protein